jgi:hypothetical protein
VRTTSVILLLAALATGCSKKCAPGQVMAKGGKCVGEALSEKVLSAPKAAPRRPHDLPKRSPLTAPSLKPLPAVAANVFGGKTPRWFASMNEVREQTGISKTPITENVAWQIGMAYSIADLRKIDGVMSQIDYLFLGDNLIGYDVAFYAEDEKGTKILNALREQAEKAYGPAKHHDNVNTDWTAPQLAVHLAVTNPPAVSKMRGHPVQRVQMTWTVPPDSIK